MMKWIGIGVLALLLLIFGSYRMYLRQQVPPVIAKTTPSPEGRAAFELMRLADPRTGEIPGNIHMREMAFAATLPKSRGQRDSSSLVFTRIGPYNVGGRTRAFAIDISNPMVYMAGGVSGGLWRSENEGASWTRVTAAQEHAAVSCITQDTRPGKTATWYYGSGETVGNSASKSFSAFFRGNGIYKSTDGGLHWQSLPATKALSHKASDWDAVFRVAVDPSRNDSDIVFAALKKGIVRSNDGGNTWKEVLVGSSGGSFSDLAITSTGVCYAALSSDAGAGARGFWRSTDGLQWTAITPAGFPSSHDRTLMAIPKVNEDHVFFFTGTPGAGTNGCSLWKYAYLSGDGTGSGGGWTNLSPNIPYKDLNLYDGYCQVLGVKPDDENVIFIGGTNLFRSMSGFTDTISTSHVGGYKIDGDTNFSYRTGVHYPDQQSLVFHPTNHYRLISTTDGGIHRTESCTNLFLTWTSLSNGYVTSQFYGIAIDHGTEGSEEVMGGLQDRGTFWTNTSDPTTPWVSVRGADGAYVAIEDGGDHHYMSTQYANIQRATINDSGKVSGAVKVMPPDLPTGSGSGLLFVHPFTLDPVNNNIMYLPYKNEVWRNNNLAAADNEDLSPWMKLNQVLGTITSIAASENPQGVLYVGTSSSRIYRIENAHTNNPSAPILISNGITNGGYTSCIAIDPYDANRLIVVYSNYNVISLWYTENAGQNWEKIEGNLTGNADAGVPPSLYYIGDGPSLRWAEIVPVEDGYRYFLGTSVGLFSTGELNGDSTVWVQEGPESIGNVVVDMLDYRAVDKWLVVGTHGNGIYTTHLSSAPSAGVSTVKDNADGPGLRVWPNPAADQTTLSYHLPAASHVSVTLVDHTGRVLHTLHDGAQQKGEHRLEVSLAGLPSGLYYLCLRGEGMEVAKALVKG